MAQPQDYFVTDQGTVLLSNVINAACRDNQILGCTFASLSIAGDMNILTGLELPGA